MAKLQECFQTINDAVEFLMASNKTPRILIKISNRLGDSIHGQPIIRHYRIKYPNACITFLTERRYHGVHQYNKDIDGLFLLPDDLDSHTRLALWNPIKTNKNIDIAIIPAINPFQYAHPENKWLEPHPNIVDQYLHNAGIVGQPLGGREIVVGIDDEDRNWATTKLDSSDLVCIEYNSYSATMAWRMPQYIQFVQLATAKGFKCASLAGPRENIIPGTIDLRGASWRQTVALLSRSKYLIGCSSGNTMLALASRPQPFLIELNAPNDCLASQTGYIDPTHCINVIKPTPANIAALLSH